MHGRVKPAATKRGSSNVIACDKRERLRKRALATKQSIVSTEKQSIVSTEKKKAGLLRGACHRARVRATRWLAITASPDMRIILAAHLARGLLEFFLTLQSEGAGMPGADAPAAKACA